MVGRPRVVDIRADGDRVGFDTPSAFEIDQAIDIAGGVFEIAKDLCFCWTSQYTGGRKSLLATGRAKVTFIAFPAPGLI